MHKSVTTKNSKLQTRSLWVKEVLPGLQSNSGANVVHPHFCRSYKETKQMQQQEKVDGLSQKTSFMWIRAWLNWYHARTSSLRKKCNQSCSWLRSCFCKRNKTGRQSMLCCWNVRQRRFDLWLPQCTGFIVTRNEQESFDWIPLKCPLAFKELTKGLPKCPPCSCRCPVYSSFDGMHI